MLIPVIYLNGHHGRVTPLLLDQLIQERRICRFRRSGGWVEVGKDPIRRSSRKVYCIPERRQAELVP